MELRGSMGVTKSREEGRFVSIDTQMEATSRGKKK